ncbi:RRP15-like protein isoform X1 [Portunus trituberculatus]|uniref:RRP15-like protein isoform X1 n=1 Tax=Portunus trituberculatus TaxID=210409 RepID=UPI001E1CC50D|nr:RRP15-like protein isoform X1 [Portunus trituberculatus]XP_045138096.1 RRP15-like protein isoform X1 [Portunus trituberculatus]
MMAISSGNVLKRPKVVEESHTSDSDDDQSEEEEEEEQLEAGDVEIKEEVEDDYLDQSNYEGDSFTAFSTNDDITEFKGEEEEVEEENKAERSINRTKPQKHKTKRTKTVKIKETETYSDDSDDMEDDFDEGESEEDNFGDDESEKEEEDGEDGKKSGSGLADMMAKILGTKKSGDIILSKAKTDMEVRKSKKRKQEDTFEIVDSSGQIKTEPLVDKIKEEEEDKKPPVSQHERDLYRKLWEEKFRKKPSIIEDREKERKLRVLATQGVVQLFSAIEKHKTMMQVKLSQCRSIMGREKVLESTGKEAFLDILKQQGKRVKKETEPEGSEEGGG